MERVWMVNATPSVLYPQGQDPLPVVEEAGWAEGPVWTHVQNLTPTRIWFPDLPAHNKLLLLTTLSPPKYTDTCLKQKLGIMETCLYYKSITVPTIHT